MNTRKDNQSKVSETLKDVKIIIGDAKIHHGSANIVMIRLNRVAEHSGNTKALNEAEANYGVISREDAVLGNAKDITELMSRINSRDIMPGVNPFTLIRKRQRELDKLIHDYTGSSKQWIIYASDKKNHNVYHELDFRDALAVADDFKSALGALAVPVK